MKPLILLTLLLLLVTLPLSDARRGGGGRGGGSRGGSSRGSSSRGSSSRGSSTSSTSAHRGSTYERKKSSSETQKQPAPSAPKLPEVEHKPSAPQLNSRPQPSAPELPSQPRQPPYNPNYGNPPGPSHGQPPPYPGNSAGSPMGPPPSYPGHAQPPPYPGPNQARPPPYDFNQGRPPPYPGTNQGVPPYGQPNQAGRPYPQQPGSAPYPQQPRPYPQQPNMGNVPYPQQPRPYPQQPGMNPNYGAAPAYTRYTSLPVGGNAYVKPYKKKGLLGQLFSGSKPSKHYSGGLPSYGGNYGGGYGSRFGGKHGGISPAMYPIIPMMMMKKPKFMPKFSSPSFPRPFIFFMPMHYHSHGYYHSSRYYDINDDDYRGRCRKPLTPEHSTMECYPGDNGPKCRVTCNAGYNFPDNTTVKENECWHVGGVWRPIRNFQACSPICKEKCENGGKCGKPDTCVCDAEYRGDRCQYHILNCNVLKLAGENSRKISWTCHHGRNETVCHVRCRSSLIPVPLLDSEIQELRCKPEGEWVSGTLPTCDEGKLKTETPEEKE